MSARLAVLLVSLAALVVVPEGVAQASDPGTAIASRLTKAGFWVERVTPLGDYYCCGEPLPQKAYTVYADERSQHAFQFTVSVFASDAAAHAAYRWESAWYAQHGTAGANKLVLSGRVLYSGETGSIAADTHKRAAPQLPIGDFHTLVTVAKGSL
ncbi:MAG TPA: hypothetical protein VGL76_02540 [Gaiellaceae bacterium]